MTHAEWPNLPAMFFDWAERKGERPFLWAKETSGWVPIRDRKSVV